MDRHPDVGEIAEILLDYVENDRTYQSDKITTVPTSSYTDPDQWQREMDLELESLASEVFLAKLARKS